MKTIWNWADLRGLEQGNFISRPQSPLAIFVHHIGIHQYISKIGEESQSIVCDDERPAIFALETVYFSDAIDMRTESLFFTVFVELEVIEWLERVVADLGIVVSHVYSD